MRKLIKWIGRIFLLLTAFVFVIALFDGAGDAFEVAFAMLALYAGIRFIFWLWKKLFPKQKKQEEEMPAMSREKENYYEELGMSPSEIELFRDTMNNAKKQINRIQKNIGQSAKLKAVDLRHDTLKAAKALFKELVKEPTRLHDASHFIYTHLPNLADLTDKYIEINEHEIKNKETYAKLEESTQVIDQLATLIVQDYQKFVSDDLDDLDVEISIAKQSLKRDNELRSELK